MAQTGDKVNWEPRRSAMLLALLAASLFAAFGGAYGAYRYLGVSSRSVTQFHILPPDKTTFVIGDRVAASAIISPDGARIAFTARDESGRIQLWIRRLGALTAQPLPGTDAAQFPFWSPNSEVLAFFANDKLLKIGVSGGPPQTICDGVGTPRGGAWNRSGTIVFASAQKGLSRVSAAGGEAIMISPLANGDVRFPTFLPDDKTMLVFANRTGATTLPIERGEADLSSGVALLSLDSADMKLLVPADSSALYVDGELLFVRGSTLFAQRFDLKSRATLGEPIPITENVEATAYAGVRTFSVSDTGILTYGMGVDRLDRLPRLTWFDRKGTVLGTVGEPAPYAGIDLSPDGRSVIAHRHEGQGGDLWMLDVNRNTTSRFTFDASQDNSHPVWSPDGSQIAFASRRQGKWGIYVKPSNFGGGESRLLESVDPVAPKSWSPDGHSLVYVSTAAKTSNDIWVLPTAGGKAFPLFSSQFSESQAQVSPNGRWLSYGSNESHENNFVYVRPFPTGAGQWQLSTPGGLTSRWRKDAKELFYLNRPINPSLMAVDIDDAGPVLSAGTPRTLFDVTYVGGRQFFDGYVFGFAVSSDGQRFLIPALQPEDSKEAFRNLIAVISNWSSVLRR